MLIKLFENKETLAKYGEWATAIGFFLLAFSAWIERDLQEAWTLCGWGLIWSAIAYSGALRTWPGRISRNLFRRYFIRS